MAKPIRATPTLRGEDAKRFILKMIEEERHPSKRRLQLLEAAEKTKFHVVL